MSTNTVIVDARRAARRVEILGMRCDAKEIPDPVGGAKPDGWWIATTAMYTGKATPGGESGALGEPRAVEVGGTAALAVGGGRLLGILTPKSVAEPAIWLSWPLAELNVEGAGVQGTFRKRPKVIKLTGPDGLLELLAVLRLYRNSGAAQPGQEGSLMKALEISA
jgi:hypothetical protein